MFGFVCLFCCCRDPSSYDGKVLTVVVEKTDKIDVDKIVLLTHPQQRAP